MGVRLVLVLASDLHTINLRHVPHDRRMRPLQAGSPELARLLESIADQVNTLRQQEKP